MNGCLFPPPTTDAVDLPAWGRFCELVARVEPIVTRVETSPLFLRAEVYRVEMLRRDALPFLLDHCQLAGKSVLEFGAGTGALSIAMAQAGVRAVTSVEPDRQRCEAGWWRVKAYQLEERVQFHHVADTARLPFEDESFDAVVCYGVLQYVPDARQRRDLLLEMHRVVRPGGLLIVGGSGNGLFPYRSHSSRWWSNLMPRRAAKLGHRRGVTYWELRRVLAPLGYRLVDHQGRAALARWNRRGAGRPASRRSRIARRALLAAYRCCGVTLCPMLGAPIEAFLPFPELAFRKV